MTVHASGHGPGCALSEIVNLFNMQVESLENIKDFVLFNSEYPQAIIKMKESYDLVSQIELLVFA